MAASEVLASPVFQRHVVNVVNRAKEGRLLASEKGLAASPAWKKYVASLPAVERRAISRLGVSEWLKSAADQQAESVEGNAAN